MFPLLMESVFFWIVCAAFLGVVGFATARGTGKRAFLWGGVGASVLTAALGAFLVFGVQTERKNVRAAIDKLADAIAQNDVDGVLKFVAQDANRTRQMANFHLRLAKINWTKIRDFEIIEINNHMSPPRALVRFRGSVDGKTIAYDAPFTIVVDFLSVELRQESDGVWRVTDKCEFKYPGFQTDGLRENDF